VRINLYNLLTLYLKATKIVLLGAVLELKIYKTVLAAWALLWTPLVELGALCKGLSYSRSKNKRSEKEQTWEKNWKEGGKKKGENGQGRNIEGKERKAGAGNGLHSILHISIFGP